MPENYTLRSYKRIHSYTHAEDVERGKIRRDTDRYVTSSQRRNTLERRLLDNPGNEELLEELTQARTTAERDRRGAKTHKTRLKKLIEQGLDC